MLIHTTYYMLCMVIPPCCRKMPEKESDHLTPATRLLEKRREMTEVEMALATQKEVRRRDSQMNNITSRESHYRNSR